MKLLAIVFLFFISNLVVFALLSRTSVPIGLAFFLWVGVFSYTAVAQFWALAADIYTEEQGKRLFPIIGIGSSVGAVAGARLAKSLVPLGPDALMTAAAVLLLVCVVLLAWVESRAGVAVEGAEQSPEQQRGAAALRRGRAPPAASRSLPAAHRGDDRPAQLGQQRRRVRLRPHAPRRRDRAPAARRRRRRRSSAPSRPTTSPGTTCSGCCCSSSPCRASSRSSACATRCSSSRRSPCWGTPRPRSSRRSAVIRLVKIGENALEYSVAETSRHALYLVTSRVEKYVGKTSVDTIAVRVGAILSGAVVWIGGRVHIVHGMRSRPSTSC